MNRREENVGEGDGKGKGRRKERLKKRRRWEKRSEKQDTGERRNWRDTITSDGIGYERMQ